MLLKKDKKGWSIGSILFVIVISILILLWVCFSKTGKKIVSTPSLGNETVQKIEKLKKEILDNITQRLKEYEQEMNDELETAKNSALDDLSNRIKIMVTQVVKSDSGDNSDIKVEVTLRDLKLRFEAINKSYDDLFNKTDPQIRELTEKLNELYKTFSQLKEDNITRLEELRTMIQNQSTELQEKVSNITQGDYAEKIRVLVQQRLSQGYLNDIEHLKRCNFDPICLPNLALLSAGARVINVTPKRTRNLKEAQQLLVSPLSNNHKFCYWGTSGSIEIELSIIRPVTSVSVGSLPSSQSLRIDTNPRFFSVFCKKEEGEGGEEEGKERGSANVTLVRDAVYVISRDDNDVPPIQLFKTLRSPRCSTVQFIFSNNYGNPKETCLYYLGVHTDPEKERKKEEKSWTFDAHDPDL